MQLFLRFFIGGAIVSLFAILGDVFRPKSFAGLFGAAPSIALAALGLTIAHNGNKYAAIEARSMALGAIAFFIYAAAVSFILIRYCPRTPVATVGLMPLWLGAALALWAVIVR